MTNGFLNEMSINQYANAIAEAIGGKSTPVEKANGVVFYGITKMIEGSNISPTIYVEDWYKRDVPVTVAAKEIEEIINKNRKENFDLDNINNFEKVKPMLRARLYNKATKAEVYRKANGFDDLIIIPYIELDMNDGAKGSIKVTDQMVNLWGVTKRTVIDMAVKNTKGKLIIEDMHEMMVQMMVEQGMPEDMARMMTGGDDAPAMYVITNRDKMFGAIQAVLGREVLKKKFPNGYTIIPSSVHEVLLIPDTNTDEEILREMIGDVNIQEVRPEEILGSKAYIFAA